MPRPWERSYRCPATARRRPAEAPAQRYQDFIALHQEIAAELRLPLRPLWCAGAAFAVLAAGTVFLAVVVFRLMFAVQVPVFAAPDVPVGAAATSYAVCALAATIQATALMHLLLATAARPIRTFGWISGIAVGLLTALPLVVDGPLDAALATSALNLAGGASVCTLIAAVVTASHRGL
ncbi:hypothetical protein [Spirillospora albida]|uniref:hypothetical protein n=1 Tax=Spirillospora albida TaxID=58123 RepID=UPI00068B1C2D|nr:hypothetical protein [Spirillospora albida]